MSAGYRTAPLPQLPVPGRLEGKAAPWEQKGFPAAFWLLLTQHFISAHHLIWLPGCRPGSNPCSRSRCAFHAAISIARRPGPTSALSSRAPFSQRASPGAISGLCLLQAKPYLFPSDEWTCQATHHNHWLPLTFSFDFLMSLTSHGSSFPSILPFPHIHQPWPVRISPPPLSRITER